MKPWLHAFRALRHRPLYASATVLVLALGIGATATLFAVVDTVLLKPLPYPNSDRLVLVLEANPAKHQNESLISPANLQDWQQKNSAFAALAGEYAENDTDTSGAEPERLAGMRVSPDFFRVMGTPPLLGRAFTPDEEKPVLGPGPVVISYGLWTRRYARSPNVLSQHLVLAGFRYDIVGVMPKDFTSSALDIWLPARLPDFLMRMRQARFYTGIGRMKPGVTIAQAQADLARVQAQLGQQYPSSDAGWSAQVSSLKTFMVGKASTTLWAIFAAVMVLLLLAVANIAGLTLAELQNRGRELAIRAAIGASRAQVVATVMREAILLAAAGALAGGALAWAGVRGIVALAPASLPRLAELQFDPRGWLFAVAISALAALGFGLGPAIAATRPRLATLLASLNAGAPGGRRLLQRGLVVGQLALTVLLVAGAGLLLRSFYNLEHVGAGFDSDHVFTFHVGAAWNEDRAKIGVMQNALLTQLEAVPGVTAAGFANFLPASDASLQYQVKIAGAAASDSQATYSVGERSISPGYLASLRTPLVAGHDCPALTRPGGAALVNQSFVSTFMSGQSVIGRDFHFAQDPPNTPASQIIGIVGDVRENNLNAAPTPFIYVCLHGGDWPDPEYVVRTAGDPAAAMAAVRGVVAGVAPGRAVFGLDRLQNVIGASLEQPRLDARFLSLFAGFALLLAAVGLYSLMSLLVAGRRRELGVRIALGAKPSQVAGLVLASTGRLLAAGIVAGLALTWAAARGLESLLFGVHPLDAATLAAALALLALIALAATLIPARRAASTDPLAALRAD